MNGFIKLSRRLLKYGLVSLGSLAIFPPILYLLVDIFGINKYFGQIIIIILGRFYKFTGHNLFTWRDRKIKNKKELTQRFVSYIILSIVGGLSNYFLYYILLKLDVYYIFASIISGAATGILIFLAANRFIWNTK